MTAVAGAPRSNAVSVIGRPDGGWLLTALAFPPAGYLAWLVAGPVDGVRHAVLAGALAGAGIGAAQWSMLRRRWLTAGSDRDGVRGSGLSWVVGTALGMSVGLAVGAALVSYDTDVASLAVMGALSGLGAGAGQGRLLATTGRQVGWTLLTAALWALGWAVSTAIGVSVEDQWPVFGISGAIVVALLQSTVVHSSTRPAARS